MRLPARGRRIIITDSLGSAPSSRWLIVSGSAKPVTLSLPLDRIPCYRGVAGRGAARRIRGLSWTGSLECATWFAKRAADLGWADPAVFQAVVSDSEVLSYTNDRREDEYIVRLSPQTRVKRYKRLLPDEPETC